MAEFLDVLRQEHASLTTLLRTLEWQVDQFETGHQPDYDVISATLDYFLSFPETHHHPKEELLFGRLRERDPETADRVGDLRVAHRELAARARRFAAALRAVLDEIEVPREALVRSARQFVDLQQRHIEMEESTLFPAAVKALTATDWADLTAAMTPGVDPLFGEHVGRRFEQLRETILRWQAQDQDQSVSAGR